MKVRRSSRDRRSRRVSYTWSPPRTQSQSIRLEITLMSTPPEKQRISARDKKEGTRLIPIQKGPCRMPSPSDGICPSPLTTHATSEHDRGSDTHHEQDDAARDKHRQADAARLGDDRMVRSPDRVQGHVLVLQWDLSAVLVGRALTVLLGVPVLEIVSVALERSVCADPAWHQSRHCAGSGLSGRPRRVLHALRCCGRLHHHACRLT